MLLRRLGHPLPGDSLFSLWFSIEQEPWKIAPSATVNESVYTSPVKRDWVSKRTLSARTVPFTTPSMYASLHCSKVASASPDWLIVSSPEQVSSPLNSPSILTLLSTVSLPSKRLPRPIIVLSACPLLVVAPFFLLLSIFILT